MNEILQNAAAEVVTIVLSFVVSVAVPYGLALIRTWVKAKTQAIEDAALRDGIVWALERLDETARTVVLEIEQTIKQRSPVGKVENPAELLSKAMTRTWARLPQHAAASLKKMYPDPELRKIIRGKVESRVLLSKSC